MHSGLSSINRLAMISFLFAALTFIFFCLGAVPIPLTAWVCFPAAVITAGISLLAGLGGLRQVRASGERGRRLAIVSVLIGVLTLLAVLCMTSLTVTLYYYGADALKSLWLQLNP